jgi:hypothetical protein
MVVLESETIMNTHTFTNLSFSPLSSYLGTSLETLPASLLKELPIVIEESEEGRPMAPLSPQQDT